MLVVGGVDGRMCGGIDNMFVVVRDGVIYDDGGSWQYVLTIAVVVTNGISEDGRGDNGDQRMYCGS